MQHRADSGESVDSLRCITWQHSAQNLDTLHRQVQTASKTSAQLAEEQLKAREKMIAEKEMRCGRCGVRRQTAGCFSSKRTEQT